VVEIDGLFREALESQRKDETPLLHLIHSNDLKSVDIFPVFSAFSFNDLLFEFLSLAVKLRLLEPYLMPQSRKLADALPRVNERNSAARSDPAAGGWAESSGN
jgi:hypothetical protein